MTTKRRRTNADYYFTLKRVHFYRSDCRLGSVLTVHVQLTTLPRQEVTRLAIKCCVLVSRTSEDNYLKKKKNSS